MSLTDQFTKRTEDVVEEENDFAGYVEKPGPFLVVVDDAYDSKIVFPDSDNRFIGLKLKVIEPLLDTRMEETEEELEDRRSEVGKLSTAHVYLTENTVQEAFGLLGGIAGEMDFPQDFDQNAKARDEDDNIIEEDGDPVYDFEYVSNNAPINPENLIGRKFRAFFEFDEYKDRYAMNMYASAALSESKEDTQDEPRKDLFSGEDTRSAEYKKEYEKRQKENDGGRDDLLDEEEANGEMDPDDELPF